MLRITKPLAFLMLLLPLEASSQQNIDVPTPCMEATSTIAVLDCLHNQQSILQQIFNYHTLVAKISKIQSENKSPAPQASLATENQKNEHVLDRINWFDQHMEVYAIVGSPEDLIAYARLDGNEYRLKKGDSIRLALVSNVYQRGIDLVISGHKVSIGLSGRSSIPTIGDPTEQ